MPFKGGGHNSQQMENQKAKLDTLVERFNTPEFIKNDPVQFPRMFTDLHDIEVSAFLCSLIAWGNRKIILKDCQKMLDIMDGHPYKYVMDEGWSSIDPRTNIHRTFFGRDLQYMCRGLKYIYTFFSNLENLFSYYDNLWTAITYFRIIMSIGNDGATNRHIPDLRFGYDGATIRYIPDLRFENFSHKNAPACKRMHLMLRWLVRKDGIVDLGVWKKIDPSSLFIPLDTHVSKISRDLGMLSRTKNDRLAAEQLTEKLREFDPLDPCKYDFALFGYGESLKHKK